MTGPADGEDELAGEIDADEESDAEALESTGRAGAVLAYLAAQLTEEPDAVRIDTEPTRHGVKLSLRVAPDDMGRIIGRRGRVAQSIRTVVRAAAASERRDVSVDIVD